MKFKSRKDWLFLSVSYGTVLLCLAMFIGYLFSGESSAIGLVFMSIVLGLTCWLILSMLLGTNYVLDQTQLHYTCGPVKGKIEISSIRKIEVGKSLWTGLRVATAMNGLIVYFGKYDEIYISPDSNERFIEELLKLKPDLEVK